MDDDGYVRPLTGGLSVAPGDPMNLPGHRRPAALGGMGKDPVWRLDLRTLDDRLIYRPDPARPEQHGFIEPAIMMRLDDLQTLIAGTWPDWKVV